MPNDDFDRILTAAHTVAKAQEPIRFATQEDYDAWRKKQIDILVEAFAPIGDEPYEQNIQGHKVALRFSDIHTFEVKRILATPYIVGDFATYDEYQKYVSDSFYALLDSFGGDSDEE